MKLLNSQSFGSVFLKNPLYFHSPFSLLLIYIHISTALHAIQSQIRPNKKRCHWLQPFNNIYITPTLRHHLIPTCMNRLWSRKRTCSFYSVTVAYDFDVKVIRCEFCEGCDKSFTYLEIWFGKVVNLFCFRTKEKETL